MPDARTSSLGRIQKTSRQGSARRERSGGKHNNEVQVWCGSRNVEPGVVYRDRQDGFMMKQYARAGVWGSGDLLRRTHTSSRTSTRTNPAPITPRTKAALAARRTSAKYVPGWPMPQRYAPTRRRSSLPRTTRLIPDSGTTPPVATAPGRPSTSCTRMVGRTRSSWSGSRAR
jgi:hypothetical protein